MRFLAESSSFSNATVCEFLVDDLLDRGLLGWRVGGGGEAGRVIACLRVGSVVLSTDPWPRVFGGFGFGASAACNSACREEDRGGFWVGGVRRPFIARPSPSLSAATCCGMGDVTGDVGGCSSRSKEEVLGRGGAAVSPGFGGCPLGGGPAGPTGPVGPMGPVGPASLEGPLSWPFSGLGSPVGDL